MSIQQITANPTQIVTIDKVNEIIRNLSAVPVGTIIWCAASVAPEKYIGCFGYELSRTNYWELFNAIGTTYGAGDGSTTFNVPNLYGRFIEGGGPSGTTVNAGLPNISGSMEIGASAGYSWPIIASNPSGAFGYLDNGKMASAYSPTTVNNHGSGIVFSAYSSNSIYGNSTTVQPNAMYMLPIIRYEV